MQEKLMLICYLKLNEIKCLRVQKNSQAYMNIYNCELKPRLATAFQKIIGVHVCFMHKKGGYIMEYGDFYDIAVYGNENWKGSFTPKEIACNAYDYYAEFKWSVKNKQLSATISTLCKNLIDDIESDPDNEQAAWWVNEIIATVTK